MDTLYEKIYCNGVTYLVTLKAISSIEIGDKILLPDINKSTDKLKYIIICTIIEIKEFEYGERIKIKCQEKEGIFNFIFDRGSFLHLFHKISKINLANKKFWRSRK